MHGEGTDVEVLLMYHIERDYDTIRGSRARIPQTPTYIYQNVVLYGILDNCRGVTPFHSFI